MKQFPSSWPLCSDYCQAKPQFSDRKGSQRFSAKACIAVLLLVLSASCLQFSDTGEEFHLLIHSLRSYGGKADYVPGLFFLRGVSFLLLLTV